MLWVKVFVGRYEREEVELVETGFEVETELQTMGAGFRCATLERETARLAMPKECQIHCSRNVGIHLLAHSSFCVAPQLMKSSQSAFPSHLGDANLPWPENW